MYKNRTLSTSQCEEQHNKSGDFVLSGKIRIINVMPTE